LRCEAKQNGKITDALEDAGRGKGTLAIFSPIDARDARPEPTASASLPRPAKVVEKLSAPHEFQVETCRRNFPLSRF
jgi:hypothetical protein